MATVHYEVRNDEFEFEGKVYYIKGMATAKYIHETAVMYYPDGSGYPGTDEIDNIEYEEDYTQVWDEDKEDFVDCKMTDKLKEAVIEWITEEDIEWQEEYCGVED